MGFEIGVNLRVTECLDKGDRNYMEDFSKCYFEKVDGSIVFGFFAIFDGHGGSEAAIFAKKNLMKEIKKVPSFWSENDGEVLSAIKQGFVNTHQLMWKERAIWSKTISGFDSTAGTTATVAIVRNKKLYIGHVGDSACVLGYSKMMVARTDTWDSLCLTVEHKPSNETEKKRIEKHGGVLARKSGIQRVVWTRPKFVNARQDIVEGDSIEYEQVPFLAVTRSLGDLWSYDINQGVYHISPEPDVQCISLDCLEHRCLILGSDGLWNVVSIEAAIELVRICERETERRVFLDPSIDSNFFYNPAAALVKYSVSRWKQRRIRADNISVLVIMIDPPGPSMTKRRDERRKLNFSALDTLFSLTGDGPPSNETFTRLLSQEFLVECNRWRSANDARTSAPLSETYCMVSASEQRVAPLFTPDNHIPGITITTATKPPDNGTMTTTRRKLSAATCQDTITADPHFLKCCITWINNIKLWGMLAKYFQSRALLDPVQIIMHLNSLGPGVSAGHILLIMPWIFAVRTAFKINNPALHAVLAAVPLFCEFWLDLYADHIEPVKRSCTGLQHSGRQALVSCLSQEIVGLLKHYQYLTKDSIVSPSHPDDHNGNNELSALRAVTGTTVSRPPRLFGGFRLSEGLRLKWLLFASSLHKNRLAKSDTGRVSLQGITHSLHRRSVSEKQIVADTLCPNTPWMSVCSRRGFRTTHSTSDSSRVLNSLANHPRNSIFNSKGWLRDSKSQLDLQAKYNNLNNSSVIQAPVGDSEKHHPGGRWYKSYKQYLSRFLLANFK